jgi:hypothetical protein
MSQNFKSEILVNFIERAKETPLFCFIKKIISLPGRLVPYQPETNGAL